MFSWLRRRKDGLTYEAELSALDGKIRATELALSTLQLKERKSVYFLAYYSLPLYLTFCTWAIAFRGEGPGRVLGWLPSWALCALPLGGLYALYRALTTYYGMKRKYEVERIARLRAQQKLKVEELKETTKYYAMKGLIERYDKEGEGASSSNLLPPTTPNAGAGPRTRGTPSPITRPLSMSMPSGGTESRESSPSPSVRRATSLSSMLPARTAAPTTTFTEGGWVDVAPVQQQQQQQHQQPPPIQLPLDPASRASSDSLAPPAPTTTWLDRLLDRVIGAGLDGPTQKYAYICRFCYSHNGLCYESEWRRPFKCWSCGQLNHAHGEEEQGGPPGPESTPAAPALVGGEGAPSSEQSAAPPLPASATF